MIRFFLKISSHFKTEVSLKKRKSGLTFHKSSITMVSHFKMIGGAHLKHFIREKRAKLKILKVLEMCLRYRIKHEIKVPFDKGGAKIK